MNDSSINILQLILEASLVVQIVMAILLVLSVVSWVIIFQLANKMSGAARFDERFEAWFWKDDIATQYATVKQETERTGLEQVFYLGYKQATKGKLTTLEQIDVAERGFRVALGKQQSYLEQGLSTLASIGSVSPYIGLFGTVWGIMHAFIGLGQAESVSLAIVAPAIAEALIATALGLFAAIPATLAFNHFTTKANTLYERRALFCEDVVTTMVAKFSSANQSSDALGTQTPPSDLTR